MKRIKTDMMPRKVPRNFVPSKVKTRNRYAVLRDKDGEIVNKFDTLTECQSHKKRMKEEGLVCEGAWRTTVTSKD